MSTEPEQEQENEPEPAPAPRGRAQAYPDATGQGAGMDDVDKIAGYAEQAQANDTFWFELGYWTGYAEGLSQR